MAEEESFMDNRALAKVGDITAENVDAIVNAANSSLMGGGGVDGAIHRAGGPAILEECRSIRDEQYPDGLPAGEAVITTAGNLPARYVIHTVGPVWGQGGPDLLANCYGNSLALALRHGLETIAFPAISTGVYRFPKDLAAEVSSSAVQAFLAEHGAFSQVRFVFFAQADLQVFLDNCVWR